MKKKRSLKRCLLWGDSVHAKTGFGRVMREIVNSLPNEWEFDQVAINHHDVLTTDAHPRVKVIPATSSTKGTKFGEDIALKLYREQDYDAAFILNDLDVLAPFSEAFGLAKDHKRLLANKWTPIVFYFPVDGPMLSDHQFLRVADVSVTYTQWAKNIVAELLPPDFPVKVVAHGTDVDTFKPLPSFEKRALRKQLLGVYDDDKFVIINVNTNSARKDIFQSIQSVRKLIDRGVDAMLYLHCGVTEVGFDVGAMIANQGMRHGKDILVSGPRLQNCSDRTLNALYNAADCYITTSRREGWGLTSTEAAAAKIPVVAPNYGPFKENFGNGRGYLHDPCSLIWNKGDNRGNGYFSSPDRVADMLEKAYTDRGTRTQQKLLNDARNYVSRLQWRNVNKEWVRIFKEISDPKFFDHDVIQAKQKRQQDFDFVGLV